MDFLQRFHYFLLAQKKKPSKATIKNYKADVGQFIRWIETRIPQAFTPASVSPQLLEQYKTYKTTSSEAKGFSARSADRHFSSLRKFFQFLSEEKQIAQNPFEQIQAASTEAAVKDDPWLLRNFKNYLYVYNASHLTIKNYIIDVRQFLDWAEEVTGVTTAWSIKEKNVFEKISPVLVEEYKRRLLHAAGLSPLSINRKLSSIRRYIQWAQKEGLIKNYELRIKNYGKENVILNSNNYHDNNSLFPPVRLAQKISKGIDFLFDASVIALLARSIEELSFLSWKAKGKPVFRASKLENETAVPKISNIPKSFYAPTKISTHFFPLHKKLLWHIQRAQTTPFFYYFRFAVLVIFFMAITLAGYKAFFEKPTQEKPVLAATAPNRILSFQVRLTDSSDNPITTPQTIRFIMYIDPTASGSARKWEELDTISPDADGVFSILLGVDGSTSNAVPCGLGSPATRACGIPQSLFAQYGQLWLGVTIGNSPELTPRQQLATVAYASNAEVLQGLPPTTDSAWSAGTANTNAVLALNASGTVAIPGSASTTLQATGGQFVLSGQGTIIQSNSGSAANVALSPDGLGKIDLQKPLQNSTNNNNLTTASGAVEVDDMFAILATSSGQSALTINQNSTGPLISASSSGTAKFTLDYAGNGYFAGNVGIGNLTPLTALDITGSASLSANLSFRGAGTAHTLSVLDNGTFNILRSPGGDAGTTSSFYIGSTGNVGIGTTSPVNSLAVISTTTPQLRVGYDNATNYLTTAVSSAGAVTFDTNGGSAAFTFSDAVTASSTLTVTSTTTLNGNTQIGDAVGDTLTVYPTTLSFLKENAHTIQIADSTTSGAAGGALSILGAAGNGAAAGGAISLTTGAGGATSGTSGDLSLKTGTTTTSGTTGAISLVSGNSAGTSGAITIDSGTGTATGTIGIGTTSSRAITVGNTTGATALTFNSGTGSQTFTSNVVSGTTTTSGFVFDATAITTGTGLYLTTDSATTGRLLDLATTGNTWTGNSTTNGLANIASTSTAGTASDASVLLNLSRSGANANTTHTAYGLYAAVTNTNAASGTNIAGYFSASGATTANYGLIVAAGNVGIGTTAPTAQLELSGATAIKSSGTTWSNPSDIRLKNIVGNYDYGLNEIMQINPVVFTFKEDNALGIKDFGQHIGIIAQEVQTVIPEAVNQGTDGYLRFNIDPVLWASINAIKQQQTQIASLSAMIKARNLTTTSDLLTIEQLPTLKYQVQDSSGNIYNKIVAFAEATIGKIRTGLLEAEAVTTKSLTLTTENMMIAGVSLQSYVARLVDERLASETPILSPIASIDQLKVNTISPLASDTITVSGNASVSGTLATSQLTVTNDATISGTLHAKKIIAEEIEGLEAKIGTLSASLLSPTIKSDFASVASFSGQLGNLESLTASFGQFNQGLIALGPTSLTDTAIAGQLSISGKMVLTDNTINTLGTTLELQPLRQGNLSFMAGLIVIDTDGNFSALGNATFAKDITVKGKLAANIISPLASSDLSVNLGGNDSTTSSLLVNNASGSGVLKVDQKGNITASGSGTFASVIANALTIVRGVQADTSLTETVASGSAGTATIIQGETERTIINTSTMTDTSLIYLSPASDTLGLTPYIARQTTESFTLQIPQHVNKDIKINWWIVN